MNIFTLLETLHIHFGLFFWYHMVKSNTKEDAFNYHLSSSRIQVERTFDTMYSMWGILWKPLSFTHTNNAVIEDTICRLHNFILEYKQSINANISINSHFDFIYDDIKRFLDTHYDDFIGIFGDETDPSTLNETISKITTID